MPDSTLAALTAATPATGGLFYGIQSGGDRKFTLSAAGAAIAEAASAADQRTALGAASTSDLGGKLNLTGGTLTGPLCVPLAANIGIANARNAGVLFGTSAAASTIGITGFNSTLQFYTQSQFPMQLNVFELGFASTVYHSWSSSSSASSSKDLFLGRAAAATLQLGQNHASTPTAQTIKAHDVTTGSGADLSIRGGSGSIADGFVRLGTATGGLAFFGTGGSVQYQGDIDTNVTSSGSGDNVLVDTQFDGGSGNSYTIGGIIKALKSYGILG